MAERYLTSQFNSTYNGLMNEGGNGTGPESVPTRRPKRRSRVQHEQQVAAANAAAVIATPEAAQANHINRIIEQKLTEIKDPTTTEEKRTQLEAQLVELQQRSAQSIQSSVSTPEAQAAIAAGDREEVQTNLTTLLERAGIPNAQALARQAEARLAVDRLKPLNTENQPVSLGTSPDIPAGFSTNPNMLRSWVEDQVVRIESLESHLEAHDLRFIGDLKTTIRTQVPDIGLATEMQQLIDYRISLHEAYIALHYNGDIETWAGQFKRLQGNTAVGSPGMVAIYNTKGVREAMQIMEGGIFGIPGVTTTNIYPTEAGAFFRIRDESELDIARQYFINSLPATLSQEERDGAVRIAERMLRVTGQSSVYNRPEVTVGGVRQLCDVPLSAGDKWDAMYAKDEKMWEGIHRKEEEDRIRRELAARGIVIPPNKKLPRTLPVGISPVIIPDMPQLDLPNKGQQNTFISGSGEVAFNMLYYYPMFSAFVGRRSEVPLLRQYANLRTKDFLSQVAGPDSSIGRIAGSMGIPINGLSDLLETRIAPSGQPFHLIDALNQSVEIDQGFLDGVKRSFSNKGMMDTFLSAPIKDGAAIVAAGKLENGLVNQDKLNAAVGKSLENFQNLGKLFSGGERQGALGVKLEGLIKLMKDNKEEAKKYTSTYFGPLTARTAVGLAETSELIDEDSVKKLEGKTKGGYWVDFIFKLMEVFKEINDIAYKFSGGR